jgi:hypothetical protein
MSSVVAPHHQADESEGSIGTCRFIYRAQGGRKGVEWCVLFEPASLHAQLYANTFLKKLQK